MNYNSYLKILGVCIPNSRMTPQRWYMTVSLHLKNYHKNLNKHEVLELEKKYDKELGVDFPSSRFRFY